MRHHGGVHRALLSTAAIGAAVLALAACGSDDDGGDTAAAGTGAATAASTTGGGEAQKVAVLLPDTQSSVRWETADRPLLQAAFDAAGVPVEIHNAQGDKSAQQQQAEQAITNGAKILLLTNLDSGSGAAIQNLAAAKGVKVIDYDRLTLNGKADYYVSFDNVKVGELQGQGLVDCLEAAGVETPRVAVLNGSPDDNNATLFAQGDNSVIDPKFESGEWVEVADQSVPDWDNQQALTIYEQMLQKADNRIDGVLAANDGLANSVISAQKARKLDPIPVTGQDATLQGLQNILVGDQCMTVYKAIKAEAEAAAQLAIALSKGEEPPAGLVNGESDDGQRQVPSVLLTPVAVTKENIAETVLADEFVKRDELCAGAFEKACDEAGI
ncbi:MAG: substrate-binding domain-containing protein [Solirubrobacteraceae bacterium]|nr:substrate-binding domain-containing protein [Solirubrobacteraceae bacterium]